MQAGRRVLRHAGWTVVAHSEMGYVRRRLEDAWNVAFDARLGSRPVHAFAVFDGLGGVPHGDLAAQAAAQGLVAALASAKDPREVLGRLNPPVMATGGATTAALLVAPTDNGSEALVLTAGDSGAYDLGRDGLPRLLAPKDSGGGNIVSDYLGNPDLLGHVETVELGAGRSVLLCTDGVDEVVGHRALRDALEASPERLEGAVDGLLQAVREEGAPDNATVVVVRRA